MEQGSSVPVRSLEQGDPRAAPPTMNSRTLLRILSLLAFAAVGADRAWAQG